VGLHAGWVFIIKFSKTLTDAAPPGAWSFLVGSYDGYTGYLAAGWMGILSLLLGGWLYWRGRENRRVS
jgi:LPXTG-motif cell wall-anchored protein